jgi:hypothetical protein
VALATRFPLVHAVKNEWRYNSTPPICLDGMDMAKFTFTYLLSKFCREVSELYRGEAVQS